MQVVLYFQRACAVKLNLHLFYLLWICCITSCKILWNVADSLNSCSICCRHVVNCTSSYIQNRKRPCPCVCAAVSASNNPLLSSDRLRYCDRYTRCQQSLAVKPLTSRPAMSGSQSHRGSVRRVSRYQFTHVRYRTAAAGVRAR